MRPLAAIRTYAALALLVFVMAAMPAAQAWAQGTRERLVAASPLPRLNDGRVIVTIHGERMAFESTDDVVFVQAYPPNLLPGNNPYATSGVIDEVIPDDPRVMHVSLEQLVTDPGRYVPVLDRIMPNEPVEVWLGAPPLRRGTDAEEEAYASGTAYGGFARASLPNAVSWVPTLLKGNAWAAITLYPSMEAVPSRVGEPDPFFVDHDATTAEAIVFRREHPSVILHVRDGWIAVMGQSGHERSLRNVPGPYNFNYILPADDRRNVWGKTIELSCQASYSSEMRRFKASECGASKLYRTVPIDWWAGEVWSEKWPSELDHLALIDEWVTILDKIFIDRTREEVR